MTNNLSTDENTNRHSKIRKTKVAKLIITVEVLLTFSLLFFLPSFFVDYQVAGCLKAIISSATYFMHVITLMIKIVKIQESHLQSLPPNFDISISNELDEDVYKFLHSSHII
jgi:hypothetical protein